MAQSKTEFSNEILINSINTAKSLYKVIAVLNDIIEQSIKDLCEDKPKVEKAVDQLTIATDHLATLFAEGRQLFKNEKEFKETR